MQVAQDGPPAAGQAVPEQGRQEHTDADGQGAVNEPPELPVAAVIAIAVAIVHFLLVPPSYSSHAGLTLAVPLPAGPMPFVPVPRGLDACCPTTSGGRVLPTRPMRV